MRERSRLGGYRLGPAVGRGGFSTVYRTSRHGRALAVKVFDPLLGEGAAQRSFERERQALSRLEGIDGILDLVDGGIAPGGQPYLVMPLMEGGSLADVVRARGALPIGNVVELGISVTTALAAAHEAGVLHRDIKASNVLFDGEGRAHLADFGLSLVGPAEEITLSGAWVTPAYVAPEVIDGAAASVAADLYSVGATLHLALLGTPPFGTQGTIYEQLHAIRSGDGPLVARPDAPDELNQIVGRLLARDPAGRPAGAGLAAIELAEVRDTFGLTAASLTPSGAELPTTSRRRTGRVLVAATVVGALAAAAITGSLQGDEPGVAGASSPSAASTTVPGSIEVPETTGAGSAPTGPGLQGNVDYLDREDTSPRLQEALAVVDGRPLSDGTTGFEYRLPGLRQAPARFDYFFVGGRADNEFCQARLGTNYVVEGVSSRAWLAGPLQLVAWQFDDEVGAHSYFTGLTVEYGVEDENCRGWHRREPGPNAFDGVVTSHRETDLTSTGFDELNDWIKTRTSFADRVEHRVLARLGRVVVGVMAWYPPGETRVDQIEDAVATARAALVGSGLAGPAEGVRDD